MCYNIPIVTELNLGGQENKLCSDEPRAHCAKHHYNAESGMVVSGETREGEVFVCRENLHPSSISIGLLTVGGHQQDRTTQFLQFGEEHSHSSDGCYSFLLPQ